MASITENELGQSAGQDSLNTVNAMPAFRPKAPAKTLPVATETPSTLNIVTEAFRQHNSVSAAYENFANPYNGSQELDRDFSPRRKAQAEGFAEYADDFTKVRNAEEYDYVKQRVLDTKASKHVLENAGWGGVGGVLAASVLDPVGMLMMAVPGVGEARIAQIGSSVLRVGARAASYTAAGAGAMAVQEGVLNEIRPNTEDMNVTSQFDLTGSGTKGAAIAGIGMSLFGVAGRSVSKASKSVVAAAIDKLMVDPAGVLLNDTATAAQRAAGTVVNDAGSKLYMNAGTKAIDKLVTEGSFGLVEGIGTKLAKSPFDMFRRLGQQLSPDILQRVETKSGIASPRDAKLMAMMESNSDIHDFNNTILDTGKALDSLKTITPSDQAVILDEFQKLGLGAKSIDDITPASVQAHFRELVGWAVASGKTHVIPEVEQAAEKLRKIFAKDWERINAQGLGDAAHVAGQVMPAYFTRVFNKQGIATNQLKWINDVAPHIEQSLLASGAAPADAAKQAQQVAISAANKIMGMGSAGTGEELTKALSSASPMGKLAARTLDVPHEVLAPFLEHDAVRVLQTYKRSVEPQLALKELFGHTEFSAFKEAVIDPEFNRLKALLVDSSKTATGDDLIEINKQIAGFDGQWREGLDIAQTLFDGIKGQTKMSQRAHTPLATTTRILRKGVGMISLSGQVLSSLGDIPRQVGTHGIAPVMGAWGNFLTSKAFRSMSIEGAERVGVALELTMNKLKIHGESGLNGYEREVIGHQQGSIERGVEYASEKFQWLNGAMAWNDVLRSTTASIAEDRLLRAATTDFAKLPTSDREWLAVMGVDEAGLKAIGGASQGNTVTQGNFGKFMSTELEDWTDLEAARTFKLAVLKDAQTTAMTPFQGTLPSWYDSEVGKFMWQFKSFISASYQQTLLVGLQRNDARIWQGLVGMIGMGMAVSAIKDKLAAKPEEKEKTWGHLLWEGVDRSGAFDAPLSLAAYVDAAGASLTGKSHLPFADNNRRPHSLWDALGGPTGSTLNRAFSTSKRIVGDDGFDEKAQQGLMGVTPFHKWLGLDVGRAVVDAVHGHTQYIDKVREGFASTFPDMSWENTPPEPGH